MKRSMITASNGIKILNNSILSGRTLSESEQNSLTNLSWEGLQVKKSSDVKRFTRANKFYKSFNLIKAPRSAARFVLTFM